MFFNSAIADCVFLVACWNHPTDIPSHSFIGQIPFIYNGSSHIVHVDNRLRLKRTLPVSTKSKFFWLPNWCLKLNWTDLLPPTICHLGWRKYFWIGCQRSLWCEGPLILRRITRTRIWRADTRMSAILGTGIKSKRFFIDVFSTSYMTHSLVLFYFSKITTYYFACNWSEFFTQTILISNKWSIYFFQIKTISFLKYVLSKPTASEIRTVLYFEC